MQFNSEKLYLLMYVNDSFVGLEFKKKKEKDLICFVDADWANDLRAGNQ